MQDLVARGDLQIRKVHTTETAPTQEMLSTSAGVEATPQEKTSQAQGEEGKEALICSFSRMGSELKSQPLRNCLRNVAEENSRVPCLGWLICCWFYGVFRQWKMQEIQLGFGLFLMFCIQGESISLKC